jgi:hypothetical protein
MTVKSGGWRPSTIASTIRGEKPAEESTYSPTEAPQRLWKIDGVSPIQSTIGFLRFWVTIQTIAERMTREAKYGAP